MKRGDLTDDELKQCIMSLPEMKGIDERLIQLFTELVGKYASQISMKEFSDEGMYGLLMRRQRLQEFIRNKGAKNIHGLLYKTIGFAIKDLLREKIAYKKEVVFDADMPEGARMPNESTEQSREADNEKFDLADGALAKNGGKMRCGFLIAYEGIERPLKDERAEIQTGGADIFKRRLAHADRPTVGEVSASATELSAHNKDKWTMDKLVEAFNHAAGSALCLNPVTGAVWNTRIKVACKNAQSILNKDC
jgi:hypothetical protein